MENTNNIIRNQLLPLLIKYDKGNIKNNVELIISKLLENINFVLKILSSSIQFIKGKTIFLVCGFRKNKDNFFIEFYSKNNINDELITNKIHRNIKINNVNKNYIINRVEIIDKKTINEKLFKWIYKSYNLV